MVRLTLASTSIADSGPAQQCGARGQYAHPNGLGRISDWVVRIIAFREHGIEGSNRPGTLIAIPRSSTSWGSRAKTAYSPCVPVALRWQGIPRDGPVQTREGVHQQKHPKSRIAEIFRVGRRSKRTVNSKKGGALLAPPPPPDAGPWVRGFGERSPRPPDRAPR